MHELRLLIGAESVEMVSQALCAQLQALSVSVEDADAGSEHEQAIFGEPGMPQPTTGWQRSSLSALFASEELAARAAAWCIAEGAAHAPASFVGIAEVPDTDWVRLTQSQFSPIEVSPGFWIVPTWHDPPSSARLIIRLDPGLAFGTGTHPTTRMCLRWIAQHVQAGGVQRVLDYGCGSGILAIAAAMHGAREVQAVDIDPDAVRACQDNAQLNGVRLSAGEPGSERGRYDLVVANILTTPLKLLAPLLTRSVAPGGRLLLAGLLHTQAQELVDAYAPTVRLQVADREEDWALLVGTRG